VYRSCRPAVSCQLHTFPHDGERKREIITQSPPQYCFSAISLQSHRVVVSHTILRIFSEGYGSAMGKSLGGVVGKGERVSVPCLEIV
jgi:hypothetical protein